MRRTVPIGVATADAAGTRWTTDLTGAPPTLLAEIEAADNPFRTIDYRDFAGHAATRAPTTSDAVRSPG